MITLSWRVPALCVYTDLGIYPHTEMGVASIVCRPYRIYLNHLRGLCSIVLPASNYNLLRNPTLQDIHCIYSNNYPLYIVLMLYVHPRTVLYVAQTAIDVCQPQQQASLLASEACLLDSNRLKYPLTTCLLWQYQPPYLLFPSLTRAHLLARRHIVLRLCLPLW